MMLKQVLIILNCAFFLGAADSVAAEEKDAKKQISGNESAIAVELNTEDKKIVSVMEILKMMELLKEMEMIKELHLIAEEKTNEKNN